MKRLLPNSLRCYSRLPRSSSWSSTVPDSEKPLLRKKSSSSSCNCHQLERQLMLVENKVGQMSKVVSHLQLDEAGNANGNGPTATDAPTLSRMFFESDLDELKHRVCRLESIPFEDVDEIVRNQEEIIQKLKHNNAMLEKKLDHLLTTSFATKALRSPSLIAKNAAATTTHQGAITRRCRSRSLRTSDVAGCLIVLIFLVSILIGISI